jgi:hypothetical protein
VIDATITVALISVGGVGFSAVAGWATARATGRTAARTEQLKAEASAKIEQLKADALAYETAKNIWGDLIDDLSRQVDSQDTKVQALRERVELLEAGRIEDHAAIRRLVIYARELIGLLRGAGINPPTPPQGFDISE